MGRSVCYSLVPAMGHVTIVAVKLKIVDDAWAVCLWLPTTDRALWLPTMSCTNIVARNGL